MLDRAPAYRRGLADALRRAGFSPEEPDDVERWVTQEGGRAVFFRAELPEDHATSARLRALAPGLIVVALLIRPDVDAYVAALNAGASTAAPWDAEPETLLRILQASVDRYTMLPCEVVWHLLGRSGPPAPPPPGHPASRAARATSAASGARRGTPPAAQR